jgi:hypothetical protein
MVVREAKTNLRGRELTRDVAYEKTPDGRETFKNIIAASGHGGQGSSASSSQQPADPS